MEFLTVIWEIISIDKTIALTQIAILLKLVINEVRDKLNANNFSKDIALIKSDMDLIKKVLFK